MFHRYGDWVEKASIYAKRNEITSGVIRVSVSEETLDIIKNEKIILTSILSYTNIKKCFSYIDHLLSKTYLLIFISVVIIYL